MKYEIGNKVKVTKTIDNNEIPIIYENGYILDISNKINLFLVRLYDMDINVLCSDKEITKEY